MFRILPAFLIALTVACAAEPVISVAESPATEIALVATTTRVPAATATLAPTSTSAPTASPADGNFQITILHTNDVHAHHAADADGDGGEALAAAVIHQVRNSTPNTLLLSAGDTFMGTLFYVMHHGQDSAELMNAMGYDAMTLGNHEFDEGNLVLADFIAALNFPVLAANVDFSASQELKNKTLPYVILEKGGQKIAIIGLVTPETVASSKPGKDLVFQDDLAQIIQTDVNEITAQGVNKIIVLSHIGYMADLDLAEAVTGVDVVVGGHSHTLLANYDSRAAGIYPTVLENDAGKTVLVVQAGENLQFIGRLDVTFDAAGDVVDWGGDSINLSRYITPDAEIAQMVSDLYAPAEDLIAEVVSHAAVRLEGDREVCRFDECSLGNIITDAMRAETGAQIAFENSGGIRASIEAGEITRGDVLTVLPFDNLVSTMKLSGKDILAALENGASQLETGGGRFLQVSGLRYWVDVFKPVGSRVTRVEVVDAQGNSSPLDLTTMYTVAANDYMRSGGDGFTMLAENAVDAYDYGRPLDEVLADYLAAHDPVDQQIDGRIVVE